MHLVVVVIQAFFVRVQSAPPLPRMVIITYVELVLVFSLSGVIWNIIQALASAPIGTGLVTRLVVASLSWAQTVACFVTTPTTTTTAFALILSFYFFVLNP